MRQEAEPEPLPLPMDSMAIGLGKAMGAGDRAYPRLSASNERIHKAIATSLVIVILIVIV
ncbi:MAG: hypothetical protein GY906_29050 [bacterium]|nr:hypothetical protein [bacterium]